jgi:hypothetical protein
MALRGAEARATSYFKQHPRRLDQVGLNTKYIVVFASDGDREHLELGVGPDFGLQVPGQVDMQVLKVAASNMPVTHSVVLTALLGAYDGVPESSAMRTAKQLVDAISATTTARLEE